MVLVTARLIDTTDRVTENATNVSIFNRIGPRSEPCVTPLKDRCHFFSNDTDEFQLYIERVVLRFGNGCLLQLQ